MLEVASPDYQPIRVPIKLRRGRNRIDEPIDLVGLQIPDLSHFMVTEDGSKGELHATIWPISHQGPAVVNHPALDLWVGARVSAQLPGRLAAKPCLPGRSSGAGIVLRGCWRAIGRGFH